MANRNRLNFSYYTRCYTPSIPVELGKSETRPLQASGFRDTY
jgi:hypothetical protein